jgi:hypothetical protein
MRPHPQRVLEVGSRNVNGSVRGMFRSSSYLGIDIIPGPGVDLVKREQDYRLINSEFDCVVCTEALEHDPDWRNCLSRMMCRVASGGHLLMTCATDGRQPHGVDGGPIKDGEHYENVDAAEACKIIMGFSPARLEMSVDKRYGDLHVWATMR